MRRSPKRSLARTCRPRAMRFPRARPARSCSNISIPATPAHHPVHCSVCNFRNCLARICRPDSAPGSVPVHTVRRLACLPIPVAFPSTRPVRRWAASASQPTPTVSMRTYSTPIATWTNSSRWPAPSASARRPTVVPTGSAQAGSCCALPMWNMPHWHAILPPHRRSRRWAAPAVSWPCRVTPTEPSGRGRRSVSRPPASARNQRCTLVSTPLCLTTAAATTATRRSPEATVRTR